jgi:hypothetical protein
VEDGVWETEEDGAAMTDAEPKFTNAPDDAPDMIRVTVEVRTAGVTDPVSFLFFRQGPVYFAEHWTPANFWLYLAQAVPQTLARGRHKWAAGK